MISTWIISILMIEFYLFYYLWPRRATRNISNIVGLFLQVPMLSLATFLIYWKSKTDVFQQISKLDWLAKVCKF